MSLLFSVALAAGLLYLAFRGVRWGDMVRTLRHGRPQFIALAFLGFTISFLLRALRWRVLLGAEKLIAPITVFWATAVGYLGNNFLPARAGELIRTGLLARKERLSMPYVLATALTERITDAVALVLISTVAILSLPRMPTWLVTGAHVTALIALVGVIALLITPRFEPLVLRLVDQSPLPESVGARSKSLVTQFLLGLRALQHRRRGPLFVGFTVPIWLMDSITAVIVAHALHLSLSWPEALLLIAAIGLSSAAPSTPGYVGVYQFVAVTVLVPFGFSRNQALAYIIAYQAIIYGNVLVWGSLGLWQLSVKRSGAHPLTKPTALELRET